MGPIHFLAYINDLPDNITSQVRLFVDDTVVYPAISRMDDSFALQRDLDTLQTLENKWNMEFNPSKCQVLQLTRARKPIPTSYYLHNQKLDITDCVRYLGVDISQNLSFNNHIDRICNTANKTLGFLMRNLKVNNFKTAKYRCFSGHCKASTGVLLQLLGPLHSTEHTKTGNGPATLGGYRATGDRHPVLPVCSRN